jgi:DNA-binding NtrC family response regulator
MVKKFDFLEPNGPAGIIVTQSQPMSDIMEKAEKIAKTNVTVLLMGKVGTEKEEVARFIHSRSQRKNALFISVNCAGVRKELLESELFGHVKGAFTGAVNNKVGIFEQANGGTVFLEEVEKMEIECQSKLLRFLTEGEFKRIGDNEPFRSDVRIIAATDTNLDMIAELAKFLKPLYFRLAVVQLELPPLRERPEDIPLLAEHFLRRCSQKHQKTIAGFEKDVLDILLTYKWPGNVKELENTIESAVIFSPGRYLSSKDFNEYKDEDGFLTDCNLETQFRLAEFKCITKALMMSNGEITRATRLVGLRDNRKKFYELLKKHQIDISKYKKYFRERDDSCVNCDVENEDVKCS